MGCNASKGAIPVEVDADGLPQENPSPNTNSTIAGRAPKSLAFEVPFNEDEEDNVIRKHPPKRLQRLEDQQMPSLTHEALDEKQAEAEQRRLQILNQRILSAKIRQKSKRNTGFNAEEAWPDNDFVQQPSYREP